MWTVGRANKADGGGFGYLATGIQNGETIAVDDASVYFSGTNPNGDDLIGRVAKGAGTVLDAATDAPTGYQTISPVGNIPPYSLAIDDQAVYWSVLGDPTVYDAGTGLVQSAPKTGVGDGGQPVTVATNETKPTYLAADATNLYWLALGVNTAADPANDNPIFANSYLATCPKTGCPKSGPQILVRDISWSGFIALDATAIYYTFQGNSVTEGGLMKVAKP
jgi:hypothetical protein